jgi:hypothetical protein
MARKEGCVNRLRPRVEILMGWVGWEGACSGGGNGCAFGLGCGTARVLPSCLCSVVLGLETVVG